MKIDKELLKNSLKKGLKIGYWFTMGLFILIGWVTEGAALGLVLLILLSIGYFLNFKIHRYSIKKIGQQKLQLEKE